MKGAMWVGSSSVRVSSPGMEATPLRARISAAESGMSPIMRVLARGAMALAVTP